jgi:RNA polymerase sigma-70 factor (ECF subfamily)
MRSVAQGSATEDRAVAAVSDAALLAHARHDRAAFAPLYDRYFDPIFRFCFYRLGDWQEAEDAAADVFAKALGGLGRVRIDDREDGFRCWLFTIARHVVANRRRAHARHPEQSLDTTHSLLDATPTPEEIALAADDHRFLHALLAQLKPDQRDLLELRLAGLNDAQIARVLGRSHDAVRKEQSRTIRTLRGLVEDQTKGGRADA